ncbi:hypothetical protein CEH78_003073 [Salmonella enterica]|nr:hypothetical protein [Salmonella enterica]
MVKHDVWTLFTLPLTSGADKTAPEDLRLLAAVGDLVNNDYQRGVGAVGNLISAACANPNYTSHASDLQALGAFLKHTADMARAAGFMAGYMDSLADEKEGE